jgi:ribonuclease HI
VIADASFNPRNGEAVVSWSCKFVVYTNSVRMKCKDNNEAELQAVLLAVADLGSGVEIHTDSQWAIDNFEGENVLVKTSRTNAANMTARANKENLRNK